MTNEITFKICLYDCVKTMLTFEQMLLNILPSHELWKKSRLSLKCTACFETCNHSIANSICKVDESIKQSSLPPALILRETDAVTIALYAGDWALGKCGDDCESGGPQAEKEPCREWSKGTLVWRLPHWLWDVRAALYWRDPQLCMQSCPAEAVSQPTHGAAAGNHWQTRIPKLKK